MTISERLRESQKTKTLPDRGDWCILGQAADTIDALVAALHNMVYADALTTDDYEQALAALALARKETHKKG